MKRTLALQESFQLRVGADKTVFTCHLGPYPIRSAALGAGGPISDKLELVLRMLAPKP